jgi:hypothetical protein
MYIISLFISFELMSRISIGNSFQLKQLQKQVSQIQKGISISKEGEEKITKGF